MTIRIRPAVSADIPVLRELIDASVRGLQSHDYTPAQIESALATVYGVDTQLIADGTYFVTETSTGANVQETADIPLIVGCGGWSKRKTLYGGDKSGPGREAALLDPQHDAARFTAWLIIASWARRGIGSLILEACENAAVAWVLPRWFGMGATLTGVPLYQVRGYVALENLEVPLDNGESLPIVRMEKRISK